MSGIVNKLKEIHESEGAYPSWVLASKEANHQIRSDSGLYIEIWNMLNVVRSQLNSFQNATCVFTSDTEVQGAPG